jgi:hypothetical protein
MTAIAFMSLFLFLNLPEPFQNAIAHPQRVGHDRQGWIYGGDRDKEAGIDDIEIVEIVRLAVEIESRRLGIQPETSRSRLMGRAGDGNLLVKIERARRHQAIVKPDVMEDAFELRNQTPVAFRIALLKAKNNVTFRVQCDAIFRFG